MARRSAVCLVVIAALVALCAQAAMAGGSLLGLNNDCGSASQPFAQFGDYRNYTFGANGGLESGSTGWSLGGAQVVKGNESFFVHSSSDRYSLALSPGDVSLSPKLCMGTTSTVTRFFVRSGDGGHRHPFLHHRSGRRHPRLCRRGPEPCPIRGGPAARLRVRVQRGRERQAARRG